MPPTATHLAPPASSRAAALWLWLAPTLAALALRLAGLDSWSFWADEVSTLRDASQWGAGVGYPVGYAIVGLFVRVFGQSEFAARLVPALAGVATVPIVFFSARRWTSPRAASLGAWALALSDYHLFFSQFCRYYSLVTLLGLIGMALLIRGVEESSPGRLLAAAGTLVLAFLTHWSAGLLGLAGAAWLACRHARTASGPRPSLRQAALFIVPLVILAAVFTPWMLRFLAGWGPWSFRPADFFLAGAKTIARFDPFLMFLAVVGMAALRRQAAVQALAIFWLAPLALGLIFISLTSGGTRFLLIALPPAVILAGAGADACLRWRRFPAIALLFLSGLSLCAKDALYFTVERGQRPRWRESVSWLRTHNRGHTVAATAPPTVLYYGGGQALDLNSIKDASAADRLRAGGPVWFVVERTANVAPPAWMAQWLNTEARLMATFPLKVRLLDYTIDVYLSRPRGS